MENWKQKQDIPETQDAGKCAKVKDVFHLKTSRWSAGPEANNEDDDETENQTKSCVCNLILFHVINAALLLTCFK